MLERPLFVPRPRARRLATGLALTLLALACSNAARPPRDPEKAPQHNKPAEREELPALSVLQRLRGGEAERHACFSSSGRDRDGFVRLAWEINREGRVSDVFIEGSSVHDDAVERCLSEEVARLDFGPRSVLGKARWTFVHRLPKMPGAELAREKRRKTRRRQKTSAGGDDVPGVSIEEASPGSLELSRIEDVVHAGFPLFAYCYRAGLERNPALAGLVQLRFVIDEEGVVMGVMDNGSEFRDPSALDCMAEGIFALSFPAPHGGDVRVQYRIVFESG